MSESHANFFASAVPGNESSITTGSNGEQHGGEQPSFGLHDTGFTEETPNERGESIVIGSNENEGRRGRSTPDDDNPGREDHNNDSALEEEAIDLMDDVVESFRSKEITKLKALSKIFTILDFSTSRPEKTKDAAAEYYSRTLNEIEALAATAIKRGEQAQRGIQPSERASHGSMHLRDERRDADIDELISQISRESRGSKRPLSGEFVDPIDDADINGSDIEGVSSNKKRRVFESDMPWFSREEEERRTGNKECEESRRILALYA